LTLIRRRKLKMILAAARMLDRLVQSRTGQLPPALPSSWPVGARRHRGLLRNMGCALTEAMLDETTIAALVKLIGLRQKRGG